MVDIKPYDKNAKKHPQSQLKALAEIVKEVGWRQPILVNGEGVIVAGHGRYETFVQYGKEYGLKEPWIINDKGETIGGGPETKPLTPEQESAYRLADNKLNESEWDMKLVIPELKTLSGPMINITGFSSDLILEEDEQDDVVPEIPKEPQSKIGDIYELGKHKLIVGDSCLKETYEKLMGDSHADMVFTDPPYNVAYKGKGEKTSRTIENDDVEEGAFDAFLAGFFGSVRPFVKGGGGWYVFHASSTAEAFKSNMEKEGLEIKATLIWNKPTASMGWGDYRWKHEPFFYAGKKESKITFYGNRTHSTIVDFQKTDSELLRWAQKQKKMEKDGKTTIWTMKRENVQEYIHPTQKPVELVTYALANSSKEGDIVLDSFLGSGTTLIACEKAGRACRGIELDPGFADAIVERFCTYTGNYEIIKNDKKHIWKAKQ